MLAVLLPTTSLPHGAVVLVVSPGLVLAAWPSAPAVPEGCMDLLVTLNILCC